MQEEEEQQQRECECEIKEEVFNGRVEVVGYVAKKRQCEGGTTMISKFWLAVSV